MIIDFLSLPTFVMCFIVIIVTSGISILALVFIRKKISYEVFKQNHEVGGFLFNALGLIYAVLIAFVVIATWEEYNYAHEICDKEANMLQDVFLNSDGLPEQYRTPIKEKVLEYLRGVINEDWPLLSIGEANPSSKAKLLELWNIFVNMESITSMKQQVIYNESLEKINEITDYRRLRILSSQSHIPAVIWTVLIIGALTSVGFSLFFGSKDLVVQATMTALFAMTNGIILLLILTLDHPFTGDIQITPEPFEYILNHLEHYVTK